MGYDIIGDIHGCAEALEVLLTKLGYQKTAGTWRHPDRTAVFVGDFIDRGPEQVRSVQTVRRMLDAGTALAVMGNHELNAIAWHTPDPRKKNEKETETEFLRPHHSPKWGVKNRQQHAAFLAEVEDKPALHREIIDWFLTLPLWLDLPELRVVHACWHGPFMTWLSPRIHDGRFLTRELMVAATDEPESQSEKDNGVPSVFKAVEALTKGIEIPLPAGHSFCDKDGFSRRRVRIRWWDSEAKTYSSAAMLSGTQIVPLPHTPVPEYALIPASEKPVFFGHYWLTGTPSIQSDSAVCVDYSVAKSGSLVAYRFSGEKKLLTQNFVSVPSMC
ncbi:MAG: metallophosphoesterase [Bryobacteraceae bacterium]